MHYVNRFFFYCSFHKVTNSHIFSHLFITCHPFRRPNADVENNFCEKTTISFFYCIFQIYTSETTKCEKKVLRKIGLDLQIFQTVTVDDGKDFAIHFSRSPPSTAIVASILIEFTVEHTTLHRNSQLKLQ